MRPSHQEYLTPAWVRFTLTIPGQNYIDAYNTTYATLLRGLDALSAATAAFDDREAGK
jgi:hypothetical protein